MHRTIILCPPHPPNYSSRNTTKWRTRLCAWSQSFQTDINRFEYENRIPTWINSPKWNNFWNSYRRWDLLVCNAQSPEFTSSAVASHSLTLFLHPIEKQWLVCPLSIWFNLFLDTPPHEKKSEEKRIIFCTQHSRAHGRSTQTHSFIHSHTC